MLPFTNYVSGPMTTPAEIAEKLNCEERLIGNVACRYGMVEIVEWWMQRGEITVINTESWVDPDRAETAARLALAAGNVVEVSDSAVAVCGPILLQWFGPVEVRSSWLRYPRVRENIRWLHDHGRLSAIPDGCKQSTIDIMLDERVITAAIAEKYYKDARRYNTSFNQLLISSGIQVPDFARYDPLTMSTLPNGDRVYI